MGKKKKKKKAEFDNVAFVKDRNAAFTAFVVNDDMQALMSYLVKYGMATELPSTLEILKAAIYKATCACTDIPKEVKETAAKKCKELGFSPNIA